MSIDPSWPALGRTGNATFLLADPRIIVVVPDEGCTDDDATARQSVDMQHELLKTHGGSGAVIVLMDRVAHQSKGARRIYQTRVDPALITGFGLVSSSVFGRAVASVFMGLARPVVPTHMFASLALALQWAHESHDAEGHAG
jgi:hypothetical protein